MPPLQLPFFSGHGSAAVNKFTTRELAMRDAASPSGSFLLSACHQAFLSELSTLPVDTLKATDITLSDYHTAESLISFPTSQIHNVVLSSSTLFLTQTLRYLSFAELTTASATPRLPFDHVVTSNRQLGVLGFSAGILTACVVATSSSVTSYISQAVDVYRMILWMSIRCQLHRHAELRRIGHSKYDTAPWSMVILGMTKANVEDAIASFNASHRSICLYITAVVDDTSITVSGRPDLLEDFSSTLSGVQVVPTTVDTLYHTPTQSSIRAQILEDLDRRGVRFPDYTDLNAPIRSTFSGDVIDRETASGTLVETILDMVLLLPVNWNLVVDGLARSVPDAVPLSLINFGPGVGIARGVEKRFPCGKVSILDMSSPPPSSAPARDAIAVIGMAVDMPGATDATELWSVLEKGLNLVSEIPDNRFRVSDYKAPSPGGGGRVLKAHTGNFIEGADEFDNEFFKISPREAKDMDPQQRVLLQTTYHAMEQAGYVPDATPCFRRDRIGCFIGSATHDYIQNLREDIDVYYGPSTLKSFLSGRISYAMQLSGPSVVVDTACSSSLVAIYQGVRALLASDCDAAIVGGVNIISSPDLFIGLDRGHFLSPTGQCKPFDISADGYCRAEGCGIFVLKRFEDALAENDNILGIIRGVEVNQSGLAHSITHPHSPTQVALFEQLLRKTRISPDRINVVEAHGTGTQAGDPVEMESLRTVLSRQRIAMNPLHITSIKANIGHLEAASGAAGLAKLLLMMKNRSVPRQISLKTLNPRIQPLQTDHTRIDTENVSWEPSHHGSSRIALLNNFGASGSNAAALIEEHVPSSIHPESPLDIPYVFGLSAKTEVALEQLRARYLHWLTSPTSQSTRINDIAYSMTARRQLHPYRLSICAHDRDSLAEQLARAQVAHVEPSSGKVVFVFSGQGAQYLGMGSSLYKTCQLFKSCIELCHSILIKANFPGILSIIFPESSAPVSPAAEAEAFQAAIFSLEYALAKLWMSWGLSPVAVAGHSLGEYAALVVAEVISLEDALMLVATRARLMTTHCKVHSTGMLAVALGPKELQELLTSSNEFTGLSIACFNSPKDAAVSGPLSKLTHLKQCLDSRGHRSTILSVPFGYHSPAMQPLSIDLTTAASRATIRPPTLPIVSNVHGVLVQPGDNSTFNPAYFSKHCIEPVHFESGIRSLLSWCTIDAWIEIGPHTSILPLIRSNSSFQNGLLIASIRKQRDSWSTLVTSLSQIYTSAFNLQWREVFAHVPCRVCPELPLYPFSRKKFWVSYEELPCSRHGTSSTALRTSNHAMVGSWLQHPSPTNTMAAVFETPIKLLADLITGHQVGSFPLCPASVYVELALAGIDAIEKQMPSRGDRHITVDDVRFSKPLVYDPKVHCVIVTRICGGAGDDHDECGTFTVSSRSDATREEIAHASGCYRIVSNVEADINTNLPSASRIISTLLQDTGHEPPEVFSRRTAYEIIFPRIVEYSREYHSMQTLTVGADGTRGFALVKIPNGYSRGPFVVHPVFTDTLFHLAGFMINLQAGVDDAFICSSVASLHLMPAAIDNDASYQVCCSIRLTEDSKARFADVYAISTTEPRRIVAQVTGVEFRRLRFGSLLNGLSVALGKSNMREKPQVQRVHSSPEIRAVVPSKLRPPEEAITEEVIKIVSDTCRVTRTAVHPLTDLNAIGVDSLMFIEIVGLLKHVYWDLNLDGLALESCDRVLSIVRHISSAPCRELSCTSSSAPDSQLFSDVSIPESSLSNDIEESGVDKGDADLLGAIWRHLQLDEVPLLVQRCDVRKTPLFVIHDGSGLVNYYKRLPEMNRTIWAIHNTRFRTTQPWKDVYEMASVYANYISSNTMEPVFLGGWSFGGVVAYEVAQQLRTRGVVVKGIILIDSPSPTHHVPMSDSLIQAAIACDSITRSPLGPLITFQFRECVRMLQQYHPLPSEETCPPLVMLRSIRGFESPDIPLVPSWLSDRSNPKLSVVDWEGLTKQSVKIIDIPGNHFQPFQSSNIKQVAQAMIEGLEYLDKIS